MDALYFLCLRLASRAAANDIIMESPLLKEDMPMLADVLPLAPASSSTTS